MGKDDTYCAASTAENVSLLAEFIRSKCGVKNPEKIQLKNGYEDSVDSLYLQSAVKVVQKTPLGAKLKFN